MKRVFRQRNRFDSSGAQLLALFTFLLAALTSGPAAAHMGSTKALHADVNGETVDLRVEVDRVDAGLAIGLGLEPSDAQLRRHGALLSAWLSRGLVVDSDAGPCPAESDTPEIVQRDGKQVVVATALHRCPAGASTITLTDNTIFDQDPGHETFVTVAGGATEVLRTGNRSLTLSAATPVTATAAAFVWEGGLHLFTGYDHMLFLMSLILAAGLIARERGIKAALRDVALVVTAFTVGHSISLVGASLGIVSLPSRLVESTIAASIVVVAALNVLKPEAKTARPWVAGVFGIIHGFGFSSVLADVGLPTSARLVALLSFNIGIELAQLAFVAIVLLPLAALARHRRYQLVVLQGGSLAIATFGLVWLVERGLGL